MKKLALIAGWMILGCSGRVETSTTSAGGGGEGASGMTSSSAAAGQGGAGGFIDFGGGGTGGTIQPQGCSVVLDEGFYVSLVVDGEPMMLASHCFQDDGYGPYAAFMYPKGGPGGFVVEACSAPDNGLPYLRMVVGITEKGDPYATIDYADAGGIPSEGPTDTMDIPDFGEPWDNVSGTFSGKTTAPDGSAHVIDGNFRVCRRPDVYAP